MSHGGSDGDSELMDNRTPEMSVRHHTPQDRGREDTSDRIYRVECTDMRLTVLGFDSVDHASLRTMGYGRSHL